MMAFPPALLLAIGPPAIGLCGGFWVGSSQIDGTLIPSPLTPAQEASAIFRRKAIYEELHGKSHGGDHTSENWREKQNENSAFYSATADAIGKSHRSVEIAAPHGKPLGDDLSAVTGTSLDKGVELDAEGLCLVIDR
jgi:hypothetical protein